MMVPNCAIQDAIDDLHDVFGFCFHGGSVEAEPSYAGVEEGGEGEEINVSFVGYLFEPGHAWIALSECKTRA